MTAEQLHEWYPTLETDLIQNVIEFYHANQAEVDADIAESRRKWIGIGPTPRVLNLDEMQRRIAEMKRVEGC